MALRRAGGCGAIEVNVPHKYTLGETSPCECAGGASFEATCIETAAGNALGACD